MNDVSNTNISDSKSSKDSTLFKILANLFLSVSLTYTGPLPVQVLINYVILSSITHSNPNMRNLFFSELSNVYKELYCIYIFLKTKLKSFKKPN